MINVVKVNYGGTGFFVQRTYFYSFSLFYKNGVFYIIFNKKNYIEFN